MRRNYVLHEERTTSAVPEATNGYPEVKKAKCKHVNDKMRTSDLEAKARFFALLGNGVRLLALCQLVLREWSVNELADYLKVSQSVMSQHLAKLHELKILKKRRIAQTVLYKCEDDTVIRILGLLDVAATSDEIADLPVHQEVRRSRGRANAAE